MKDNNYLKRLVLSIINLYGIMSRENLLSTLNYYIDDMILEDELNELINELLEFKEREVFVFNEYICNFLFYYEGEEEYEETKDKILRISIAQDLNTQYLPSLEELLLYEDPSYLSNREQVEELANYIFDHNISPHTFEDTILILFNIAFTFKEGINVFVEDLEEEESFFFSDEEIKNKVHDLLGEVKDTTRLYILFGATVLENGDEFVETIDEILHNLEMKKEELE